MVEIDIERPAFEYVSLGNKQQRYIKYTNCDDGVMATIFPTDKKYSVCVKCLSCGHVVTNIDLTLCKNAPQIPICKCCKQEVYSCEFCDKEMNVGDSIICEDGHYCSVDCWLDDNDSTPPFTYELIAKK